MKSLFFVLLTGLLLMSAKNPEEAGIEFFKGSFTSAKIKAADEGKLFFLDFTASWCTPCRWMEETTFTDPTLAAYVKENYVALQVDIDDFDGFALKQEYQIKILPSLLIFSSKGKLLGQYEESLSPSNMMAILKKYDLPKNRTVTQQAKPQYLANQTYRPQLSKPTVQKEQPSVTITRPAQRPQKIVSQPVQEEKIELPATIMVNQSTTEKIDYTSNRPAAIGTIKRNRLVKKERKLVSFEEKPTTNINTNLHQTLASETKENRPTVTGNYEAAIPETYETPVSQLSDLTSLDNGEGLYRFKVHRQNSKGYSVQVGAYAEYGNVLQQSSLFQRRFDKPVLVHISKKSNRTLYKLMLGEFETRSAAIDFMKTVQAAGVDCMIKNLSIF